MKMSYSLASCFGGLGRGFWREATVVNEIGERWNVGVGTIDGVDHDGLIFRRSFQDHFAAHQFATGNLPLLQRDGQIYICILQDVAYRKIAFGVDSPDQGVEVTDFLLRGQPLLRAGSSAHSFGVMKGFEPRVDLFGHRTIWRNRHAFSLDIDV